jgi:hypothetical protein
VRAHGPGTAIIIITITTITSSKMDDGGRGHPGAS